jgi:hypothetical protein
MTDFSGRCACGKVTYRTEAAPLRMINCHCRDCQRASGSAFSPVIAFPSDKLTLAGDLHYFAVMSDRGTQIERGFCPACGSPMTARSPARPALIFVRAASLDDPSLYKPSANIWMRSAQHWGPVDPTVPRFDTGPP